MFCFVFVFFKTLPDFRWASSSVELLELAQIFPQMVSMFSLVANCINTILVNGFTMIRITEILW